jgi:hypothetical protein
LPGPVLEHGHLVAHRLELARLRTDVDTPQQVREERLGVGCNAQSGTQALRKRLVEQSRKAVREVERRRLVLGAVSHHRAAHTRLPQAEPLDFRADSVEAK